MTRSRSQRPSVGHPWTVRTVVVAALMALTALGAAGPAAAGVGGPIGPGGGSTTQPSDDPDRPDGADDGDDDGGDDGGGASTTAPDEGSDEPADDESQEPDADDEDEDGTEVDGESAASRDGDDGSGVSPIGLIALLGAGFLLGAALVGGPLWIALSRRRNQAPPVAPPSAQAPPPVLNPAPVGGTVIVPSARELDALRAQRDGLVEALIGLRDRLPSQALADEAAAALAAAGVEEVRPAGLPFDPSQHRAVGQVEGDGTGGAARVAEVERPGYRDGERTLRLPDVLVTAPEEGT